LNKFEFFSNLKTEKKYEEDKLFSIDKKSQSLILINNLGNFVKKILNH
jgi:hypothetical protein